MTTFLTALHIMVCIVLILVVLLQRGKGSDIGAALGGGSSNTVFGSRGAGNFLTKLTSACAVIFMCTSLSLSYLGTRAASVTIFDDEVEESVLDGVLEEIDERADTGAADGAAASADALEEVVPLDFPESESESNSENDSEGKPDTP